MFEKKSSFFFLLKMPFFSSFSMHSLIFSIYIRKIAKKDLFEEIQSDATSKYYFKNLKFFVGGFYSIWNIIRS